VISDPRSIFLRKSDPVATARPLVGRERELAALEGLLEHSPLVTITGPGGCGKTRIGLELLDRIKAGAQPFDPLVVELASVTTSGDVVDALLRALGGRERGGLAPEEVLVETLSGRNALVLLDNCEHVIDAVRKIGSLVLAVAPETRLVVTSREPLAVSGEAVFRLGPLGLPAPGGDLAAVIRSEAGRLFVDRAVAADPTFALTSSTARVVARICHQVDGLPLALILAASCSATIGLSDIADGLSRHGRLADLGGDDALPHHRSLQASLDWSYELLSTDERELFRKLSVFSGGCTLPAARSICLPEGTEAEASELLGRLEAKGLIVAMPALDGPRFGFLDTIHAYAREQLLQEAESVTVTARHLEWFCAFAREADGWLFEPWGHALVDEETPNLRQALSDALEHDVHSALIMVASLTRHWVLAEHFEEARATTEVLLSVLGEDGEEPARALAHCGAAEIAYLREDYAAALDNIRAGMALLADIDDADTEARCLRLTGMVLLLTASHPLEGLERVERSVERHRSSGDALGLAWSLVNLAFATGMCERFEVARVAYDEFIQLPGASEHPRLRTWAEQAMAWTEVIVGSPEKALAHADLALELEGSFKSTAHFQGACHRIHALARLGRTEEALDYGSEAMKRALDSDAMHAVAGIELGLVVAEFLHGDLDGAEKRAEGLLERMPQLHTAALMQEILAHIALERGDVREVERRAFELTAMADIVDSGRLRAQGKFVLGCAAVIEGETERGRELLHTALAQYAELGVERGAAEALEELALVAAGAGDAARSARLSAAASGARKRLACPASRSTTHRLEIARARSVEEGDESAWNSAWQDGIALSLADAISYARRSRGRRDRPLMGWGSLTPVELEVAELAAIGVSNPQIASQLFISRSTVKMHLSSVYLKLQIANRTELARVIATRSSDPVESTGFSTDLSGAG
jgi:predicted ATPase/DNA-binding CsgD family transcriptional regulator